MSAAIALIAAAPVPSPQVAVEAAMTDSAAGWNAGSLDRFMTVYAEDATYVTPKGLVRGKAAIAARYAGSFTGTGNRRGRLSFETLGFRLLDRDHAVLIARWILTPEQGAVDSGMTSLVFRRTPAGWRIVADHSS